MSSDKNSRKYKSEMPTLGDWDTKTKSTKDYDVYKSSSRHSSKSKTRGDTESKESSSKSRSHKERDSEENGESRHHRSSSKDGDSKHRSSKHKDSESSSHHRSSKHRDDESESKREHRSSRHSRDDDDYKESSSKNGDRHKSKSKHRQDSDDDRRKKEDKIEEEEEANAYDDDFENDFEKESDEEKVEKSKSSKSSKTKIRYSDDEAEYNRKNEEESEKKSKSKSKKYDDENDDDDYKQSRSSKSKSSSKKYSDEDDEGYHETSKSKHRSSKSSSKKYDDDDDYYRGSRRNKDYDDDDDYNRGRIVKANAFVKLPTELIEVYASRIFYNDDSVDRQKRRAKDLFKNLIELDAKSFNLLDINPSQMRTVYSSHMRHEKIQTNDDVQEIEIQTDEIDMVTKWTQFPPDDSKGFGTEDKKFENNVESASDILQKFRANINFVDLHLFMQKSSKVVEELLKQGESRSISNKATLAENKSNLDFSQGYSKFAVPKFVAKLNKRAAVSNCAFCNDNSNYMVCSLTNPPDDEIPSSEKDQINKNSSFFVVWNINEPATPYRVLNCEAVSNCLCYFSFIVISGNVDGSIDMWDLREAFNLHTNNFKSSKNPPSDSTVIRTSTYSTAGVLLNENHMSEVKCMICLQNQDNPGQKGVFMQIATLELEGKLIIWTVVELKNLDLNVFETDLGLLPGGRVKLVKSSQIVLNNVMRNRFGNCYHTLSMTVSPTQSNHLFISTNIGQIFHITRKGSSISAVAMKSNFADSLLNVEYVAFHHELQDLLLAGYGNGEVRLYHTSYTTPIKTWSLACNGNKIREIKWIESRYSCFAVIDYTDMLYVWDLLEKDTEPCSTKQLNEFGGISFASVNAINSNISESEGGASAPPVVPFTMYNRHSREIEVHAFSTNWTAKSDKEMKKFSKLIRTYLISF